ncbi:uncharacterized protein LOC120340602 isoform X2 [Styela clava]
MAYVPDYIRPISTNTSPSGSSLPTTPTHHARRTASFAIGSGHSSSKRPSSTIQSPLSDDGNPVFPTRRRSTTHPIPPSRYITAPQDRLCGRVSIKERLKSLESEASVKLEVRPSYIRSRRRGSNQDSPKVINRNNSSEDHSTTSSRSGSRRSSTKLEPDMSSLKEEPYSKTNGKILSMPKPDIIESHQPKSVHTVKPVVEILPEKTKINNPLDGEKIIETPKSRSERKLSSDSKPMLDTKSQEPKLKKSPPKQTEKKKISNNTNPIVTGNKVSLDKRRSSKDSLDTKTHNSEPPKSSENFARIKTSTPYCSSDSNAEISAPKAVLHSTSDGNTSTDSGEIKQNRTRKTEKLKATSSSKPNSLAPPSKETPKSSSGSDFKPIWRTPSMKQSQRPNIDKSTDGKDADELKKEDNHKLPHTSKPQNAIENSQNKVNSNNDQNLDGSHSLAEDATILPESSAHFEKSKSKIVDDNRSVVPIDTHDITGTGTVTTSVEAAQPSSVTNIATSYPVELRSPRNEHGGQVNRRPGARDKRNARVFIMPSSSDSDMDNPISRMDRDLKKLGGFSRAIDLLPKNDNVSENNHITNSEKTNEVSIKHVAPVKFVPYVLKSNYLDSKPEEKKDSSNTAIIDEHSSRIYPELLPSSRRKDSKSHDGEKRKDTQKSPSRRRKSTRSGRSGYNRSKSTDTRRIGHDVQRYRSNSMSESKRDRSTHGKEAVANAVVYGTSHDSTIPFIDDITTPPNGTATTLKDNFLKVTRRLSLREPKRDSDIGSIHRSNSADVLSSRNAEVSPAKMRRTRALSADRSTAKGVHRRSYQIATMPIDIPADDPRFKKFPNDSDLDDSMNADRSVDSSLDDQQKTSRSGYLHFKVATIDKGKRTSSQKSWKLVWAAIIDHHLHLSKDWSKSKNMQDAQLARQLSLQEEVQPLNIQSSLVGIAYNYLKRRNVFKLTTFNGSEYLFQAENRDDMLAWIAAIQKESCSWEDGDEINEDLILRKTNQIESGPKSDKRVNRKRSPKPNIKNNNLQVKDVDGSRRFKWRGSVNKIVKKFGTGQPFALSGTFGVHLEDCPPSASNEFVPFIVDLSCRIVEERGLHFTGIYRVPGNNASLSALQEDLNNHGVESIRQEDERLRDLNVVSSLLKSFFRKLPEPLFTNELYHDFIQANRRPTAEDRLNSLRRLVHMLPGPHYETLKFLICHLRLIADNCQENKMEVRNLAIVFGPTLVRNTAADNTATMVTDMSDQCRIIESIIEHAEWFFSENSDEAAPNIPTQTSVPAEKEREAVPSIEFLLDNVGRKPGDTGL